MTLTVLTMQERTGGDPLAIIALDLGWWRSSEEEKFLEQAVRAAGIADGRYMLALSHTHAGPVFCEGEASKPGGELIASYLIFLSEKIHQAIAEALEGAENGLLEVATGRCSLASNRDLPDPEMERLLVGWNPAIVADETVLVGRITDESGACRATLVNYACHPTILAWENTTISPDYVGAMREVVENETSAPCLFLQGCSGELAPRHQYVGDPEIADRAGRSLGHAVLGIYHGMLESGLELAFQGVVESGAPLAMWTERRREVLPIKISATSLRFELPLKLGYPTLEELEHQIETCTDRVVGERLQRRLLHRRSLGESDAVPRTHQIWRVGDVIFLSLADEAYSPMQMDLRETADYPVFLATLTNGSRGYLAPRHSYEAASYASDQSPYAPGCFEETLKRLRIEIAKIS